MKKILLFSVFILGAVSLSAQYNNQTNEPPYIEVTGSADIEVEPDEIRLAVTISNYVERDEDDDDKKKKPKVEVSLDSVEKKFMDVLSKAGVPKKNIIMKNISSRGYWYYWWRYGDDIRLTKEYEIIFNSYAELSKVLAELPGPKEGFANVNIAALKNKNIAEYRKQTKIEAMKAAKEKAQYLLESVGSTTGRLIQVIELDEDDYGWYRPNAMYSNTAISQRSLNVGGGDGGDDPSMQKIKLRYRMKARFEIK